MTDYIKKTSQAGGSKRKEDYIAHKRFDVKEDKKEEQLTYTDKKNQQKKIKKLQNQINKLEKEITTLEQTQKAIDADLANPEKFKELSQKDGFFDEYEKNRKKLQDLEGEWELAAENLERIT